MALSVAQGVYTGTGSALSVSGLTFQPRVVIVKGDANTVAYLCTDTMGTGNCLELDQQDGNALLTGYFTSLNASGFTIGTNANVNTNATKYYYMAFGDSVSTQLFTGSYTGNGSTQSITGFTNQPVLVSVHGVSITDGACWQTSTIPANGSVAYHNASNGGVTATGRITTLNSGGFSLGTNATSNTNAATYYYWAVSANTLYAAIDYTGNGAATNAITGLGIAPSLVMLRHTNSGINDTHCFQTAALAAASSSGMYVSAHNSAFDTALFNSLDSNGFTVKTSTAVNTNGDSYYAWAFVQGTAGGSTPVISYITYRAPFLS